MKIVREKGVEGKVIVCTGAAGVLCSSMTEDLLRHGAKVAVLDLRKDVAERLVKSLQKQGLKDCIAVEANVLDKDSPEAAKQVAPQKPECCFDDFEKMDIRTATVLAAERVPKTDKLLKLSIDTGIDKRTIVSGIAEYYSPEEMVGKQICILANLQPRTIRGIESRGMILMAKQGDGKMRFITPAEALGNGAIVG